MCKDQQTSLAALSISRSSAHRGRVFSLWLTSDPCRGCLSLWLTWALTYLLSRLGGTVPTHDPDPAGQILWESEGPEAFKQINQKSVSFSPFFMVTFFVHGIFIFFFSAFLAPQSHSPWSRYFHQSPDRLSSHHGPLVSNWFWTNIPTSRRAFHRNGQKVNQLMMKPSWNRMTPPKKRHLY